MQTSLSPKHASELIHSLHAILKPFLLRRLKADVAKDLPPKKEYVIYAPLSVEQRDLYDSIVSGTLRAHLMKEGGAQAVGDESKPALTVSRLRSGAGKKKRRVYNDLDGDEEAYFKRMEEGEQQPTQTLEDIEALGREFQRKQACTLVSTVMLY